MQHWALRAFAFFWLLAACLALPGAGETDFTFLHVTDTHLDPWPRGATRGESGRSLDTIRWICEQAQLPQRQEPFAITAPKPAFVLHTGDLTEYGVIGDTWARFEAAFASLPCPLYIVPGNHDQTWTAMYHILRRRHGADVYGFMRAGCCFIAINSCGPQDPRPVLERRVLFALEQQLRSVSADTPIFLFLHHPLTSTEFASSWEKHRLWELLHDRDVALILDGHGHIVEQQRWYHFDRIMGGATFGKHVGYGIISVLQGRLRASFRYQDGRAVSLVDKPLRSTSRPIRLRGQVDADAEFITLTVSADSAADIVALQAMLDDDANRTIELRQENGVWRGRWRRADLLPGQHFALLTATTSRGAKCRDALLVSLADPRVDLRPMRQAQAGYKVKPLVVGDRIITADTAGRLICRALPWQATQPPLWTVELGAEILAPPVPSGELVLACSGAGQLVACDLLTGERRWERDLQVPLYAAPLVRGEQVYIGDHEGRVHALRRADGSAIWSKNVAAYTIEAAGTEHEGTIVVGAWDGLVYGLDARDGTQRWSAAGPTGQVKSKSRYYAPADVPPLSCAAGWLVVDRGYRLGLYQFDGRFARVLREQVSAIATDTQGGSLWRTTDDRLIRADAQGQVLWQCAVPLGSMPALPTVAVGHVWVCSDRGILSRVELASGKLAGQVQVTPRTFVHAGVAVDAAGTAYVADLDGTITAVRFADE